MAFSRLQEALIELGKLGRKEPLRVDAYERIDKDKGLWRLEGNQQSKRSKDFVIDKMKQAGLEVRFDRVGNIFGKKPGRDPEKKSVMTGSHLDSVKNGGQFDGALGVMTALEAISAIKEEGFVHDRPIEMVIFIGEEGSAFPQGLIGSEALTDESKVETILNLQNSDGMTLKEVLADYRGDFVMELDDVEYFIELHPEQGPILDSENIPIGVVENITGITWIKSVVEGEENHAGTTPMHLRKDPLVAVTGVVSYTHQQAKNMAEQMNSSTVATVGQLEVYPSAPNIIPGHVKLGGDIRDGVESNIVQLRDEIIEALEALNNLSGITSTTETLFHKPPCKCSDEVVEAIEGAADKLDIPCKKMNSGAGHDAQNIAKKIKTSMIFVPSVNGISHSPWEWTHWEDVDRGAAVLKQVLKDLAAV